MEILTWALLIILLLTISIKIVKLGKKVKSVEQYISRNNQKEMHIDLKELSRSMDEMLEELLVSNRKK